MKNFSLILVATLTLAFFNKAGAQTSAAIQQVDDSHQRRERIEAAAVHLESTNAPELYPDETSDLGPQTVLKTKNRQHILEAMADVQYLFTDNMFLTEKNHQNTDVLLSTVKLALKPVSLDFAGGTLTPSVGYEHQWYDFGLANKDRVEVFRFGTTPFPPGTPKNVRLNVFDFNAQTAFAGLEWRRENWSADLGFDFRRLLTTSAYSEFYKEYVPRWGLQRSFAICEQSSLTVGYSGDYRFAEPKSQTLVLEGGGLITQINPDMRDRTDHSLFVTYDQSLCPHAVLQPYYQLKYTRFVESEFGTRNDLLSSAGLALYWTVCRNCDLRAFVDYNARFSNNRHASEYRQFDGGLGMNVTFRF